MSELAELRKKRSNFQRAITIFTNVLQTWDDTMLQDRDVEYLKVALERLQTASEKYSPHQEKLELIEEEQSKCDEINELHDRAIARGRRYINNSTPSLSQTPTVTSVSPNVLTPPSIKLPAIQLPIFDGAVENWTSFIDIFTSLIDKNPSLTPVRKLQYLRLSLSEKAAVCIKSLQTTDDNYAIALDVLTKKYSCDRRLKFRHWEILKNYPRLQRDTSTNLSDLIDTFNQHTKALENLRVPVDTWDIPLIDLITSKVSSNTMYQWELTLRENDPPSYKNLIAFLEKRSKCGEFFHNTVQHQSPNKQTNLTQNRKDPRQPQAHSYATQGQSVTTVINQKNKEPKCVVCSGQHSIYQCKTFRDLETTEKSNAVNKAKLCFNCLSSGHFVADCKSGNCRKCSGRHHTLLHSTNASTDEDNTPTVASDLIASTSETYDSSQ